MADNVVELDKYRKPKPNRFKQLQAKLDQLDAMLKEVDEAFYSLDDCRDINRPCDTEPPAA